MWTEHDINGMDGWYELKKDSFGKLGNTLFQQSTLDILLIIGKIHVN